MTFSARQLTVFVNIAIDVAKGLYLAAFAAPLVTSLFSLTISVRLFLEALILIYVALLAISYSKEISV